MVDLERMLERCERGQWRIDDFDWDRPPVPLSPEQERRVCTYFVNMSYIERLAGALFLSMSRRVDDPTLAAIFESFHTDELRHSHAAARLADHFDVNHYQVYTPSLPMLRFIPYFTSAIDSLHPAFATSFILTGELILDMALLRALNVYVDDPLSRAVVEKINQDESRHLAIDMHMTEYFARRPVESVLGTPWLGMDWWGVLAWGPGFFNEVFFGPMQLFDPSQVQLREVMQRLRRFYDRAAVTGNPAVEQFRSVAAFFESTVGATVGGVLEHAFRIGTGLDFGFVRAGARSRVTADAVPALA